MDKMREEFEAWWCATMNIIEMDLHRFADGYSCHETNLGWMAWKASCACAGMADPAVEIAELKRQRDELLAALHDAATSLETIQLRSFGADSYLDDKHSMRAYAGARAAVAREAIGKAKGSAS